MYGRDFLFNFLGIIIQARMLLGYSKDAEIIQPGEPVFRIEYETDISCCPVSFVIYII